MTRTQFFRITALASCFGLLAACGGSDPASSAAAPAAVGDAAAEGEGLPWMLDPTLLSDNALAVTRSDCASELYAAEVRWTLQPSHGSHPQIWLGSANGGEPKLWVAPSQREGAKQTGVWLTTSSVIYLVDGAKDLVIARVKLADVPCGG